MKSITVAILPMLLGVFAIGAVQEKPLEENLGMMPLMMQNCPMKLPGTEVTVEDTATGIALTFTNTPDNVAALQRRVERMAAMHNSERPNALMMQRQKTAASVKYEAIENGARLTLTPKDPAQLVEFRSEVRAHVNRMKDGGCSMMQEMMHGVRGQDKTDHSSHHP